jgi:hypothetical protein
MTKTRRETAADHRHQQIKQILIVASGIHHQIEAEDEKRKEKHRTSRLTPAGSGHSAAAHRGGQDPVQPITVPQHGLQLQGASARAV